MSRLPHRLLQAAALLSLAACTRAPEAPRALGQLAWDRLELTAEAAEPIRAIPVREGQAVGVGELLLRLDPQRAQARLAQAAAERLRAAAALAELRRGPRPERIAAAQAALDGARAALALAERELGRRRDLARQQLATPEAVDRAAAERERARAEHDGAAARLTELQQGATAEELAQAGQAVERAAAAEREAQIALDRLSIDAPRPGRVDALPFEVGERPAAGAVVAVLLVGEAPYARVYVPEPLRAALSPGVRATVRVDGRPAPYPGTVRRIAADPVFTPYFALTEHDRKYLSYLAEVTLEGAVGLPAGVPVEVEFAPAGEGGA